MMTFLTLVKNSNFKYAVLVGAISDLKNYVETSDNWIGVYKNLFGGKDFEKKLEERTVINFVDKLPNIPYLIIHGKSDDTVPIDQSIKLAQKFSEVNYDHHLVLFEKGDHFLKKHRKEVDELRKKWFEKFLR